MRRPVTIEESKRKPTNSESALQKCRHCAKLYGIAILSKSTSADRRPLWIHQAENNNSESGIVNISNARMAAASRCWCDRSAADQHEKAFTIVVVFKISPPRMQPSEQDFLCCSCLPANCTKLHSHQSITPRRESWGRDWRGKARSHKSASPVNMLIAHRFIRKTLSVNRELPPYV
jgi:hypothetical protein